MRLRIVKRPAAVQDLAEIWSYIADHGGEQRADGLLDLFDAKIRSLAAAPKTGRARPELSDGLRSFPVKSYIVFYIPHAETLEIVRVLHGARDMVPGLFSPALSPADAFPS